MVDNVAGSCDLWRNDEHRISHSVFTNCSVSQHCCSMKPPRALQKRNLNNTHPAILVYMLEFINENIALMLILMCSHNINGR